MYFGIFTPKYFMYFVGRNRIAQVKRKVILRTKNRAQIRESTRHGGNRLRRQNTEYEEGLLIMQVE